MKQILRRLSLIAVMLGLIAIGALVCSSPTHKSMIQFRQITTDNATVYPNQASVGRTWVVEQVEPVEGRTWCVEQVDSRSDDAIKSAAVASK